MLEHIFTDCIEFTFCNLKCFNAYILQELFETVRARDLIDFVKEIGLYLMM